MIDHLHDPDTYPPDNEQHRELLASANRRMYRYEGHIPCHLFITDETVLISNPQVKTDQVDRNTVIESQNETVRDWAIDVFERYQADAEEVTPEDIPE